MIERRRAKRFQVDWPVRIEGRFGAGEGFIESGVLSNISSGGALLLLPYPLSPRTKIDVYIKLPLQGRKWMRYPARVLRVEHGVASAAAVRFDAPRPDFKSPLGLVN